MQSKVVAMKRAGWGVPIAVLLICGWFGAALPDHAFADQGASMPVGGNFTWQVQLPDGSYAAGVSADLSSAITLAEVGVPPAYDAAIAAALVEQAQQLGVPMTAVATPAVAVAAPVPAPAASANVDANDQQSVDAGANGN